MDVKQCRECLEWLPHTSFTRHVGYPDSLECKCRKCRRGLKKSYTQYSQELYRLETYKYGKKDCSKCGECLPLEKFCKDKRNRDGLHYWCRACAKSYNVPYLPEKTAKKLEDAKRVAAGLEPVQEPEIKKKRIIFSM